MVTDLLVEGRGGDVERASDQHTRVIHGLVAVVPGPVPCVDRVGLREAGRSGVAEELIEIAERLRPP